MQPSVANSFSSDPDVVVIGAGLSGLAASLRLAMFGKEVLLLEKHYVVGGLNSFYARKGRKFDVGLHALTNFPSAASGKTSPLLKLCRQLRLPLEELRLLPQSHSRISFGERNLLFNNDFDYFLSQVRENFPSSIDLFLKLLKKMEDFPAYSVNAPELSTRAILEESKIDSLLGEMLLCPTCYYGSARRNDIDLPTFIMLFDAIFRQGLSRPENGIRAILDPMVNKLRALGVERRMNCGVRSMETRGDRIHELVLDSGECIRPKCVISTCGVVETARLVGEQTSDPKTEIGDFSILESIYVFKGRPADLGWNETVVFFNRSKNFTYACPEDPIDLDSGVVCLPDNYGEKALAEESKLRVTNPANHSYWAALPRREYMESKRSWERRMLENALRFMGGNRSDAEEFSRRILLIDSFTPTTIERFTGHVNGALYGSPTKSRDGSTKFKNLFLAGTDQGYVGIVGAMLGGIAVANNQILRSKQGF